MTGTASIPRLDFFVPGTPVPQGSLRPIVSKSTGQAFIKNSPQVVSWRMKVAGYAHQTVAEQDDYFMYPITGPVGISLTFALDRPQFHQGTGKNAGVVKASAPAYPIKPPDIDKLVRAILDALTDAQVWHDDSQVVWVQATKVWVQRPDQAGVHVKLGPMK